MRGFFKSSSCRVSVVIAVLLLLPLAIYAAAVTFTEHTVDGSYLGASHAVGVDFDLDGDIDIATVAYQDGDASWYRNNGSQSFTEVTIDGSLGAPIKLQVVDLDDDGDLDMAVADYGSADLIWYENTGSMSFAAKQTVDSTISGILDFYVVDFSGDGNDDFVATGRDDNTFAWYKNDGSETFTQIAIDSSLSCPYNVHAGDIDGDSDQDIVTHSTCEADLFWYKNSGTGSFTKITIDNSTFSGPRGIHIDDIDDDGDSDFVMAAGGDSDVLWFRNSGTGSFKKFTVDSSISGPHGVSVGDVDGDGDQDILSTAQSDEDLIWYDNDGSESFTERTIDSTAGYPYWVHTIDLDKDFDTDVVSADYNGGDVKWYEQSGTGAPEISTLSPTDNSSGASLTTNLVMTFDEIVQGGTGSLTIKKSSDSSTVETISANNTGLVSGSGTTIITVNPASTLTDSTMYYITITANAFRDATGLSYAGITAATTWNFYTVDTTSPTVTTYSPTDNAIGVSTTANLVVTFSEVTRAGTGTLTIKKTSDDSTVETLTVSGALLSGNGTTQLTLNPSSALAENTSYYVVWNNRAFKDRTGNMVAALTSTTTWNFTTVDTTAPTISTLSPADGATDVSATANLVMTFDEVVQGGTGTVVIKKVSDSSTVETIYASGALVSGSGSVTITVNPSVTLADDTAYYITISQNAFRDASRNFFAGISATTTWNFQTAAAPVSSSSSSASEEVVEEVDRGGGRGGTAATAGMMADAHRQFMERRGLAPAAQAIAPDADASDDGDTTGPATPTATMFSDVQRDDWYAPYVVRLKRDGVIDGYADADGNSLKTFKPENPVTYAEFSKMILLLSERPPSREALPSESWATPYLAHARGLGFSEFSMADIPDNDPMTRGAVVRTALEAFGIPPTDPSYAVFDDAALTHPDAEPIMTAYSLGIITGDAKMEGDLRTVRPDDPVNRAEVAKILTQLQEQFPEPLSEDLAVRSPKTADAVPAPVGIRYVASPILNLRADSRADAALVDVLDKDAELEVLRIVHDDWAQVRLPDGNEGYVWRGYLRK